MMSYPYDQGRSNRFLIRLILGVLTEQSPEEFAQKELDIMEAGRQPPKLCEHGLPAGCCIICIAERKAQEVAP